MEYDGGGLVYKYTNAKVKYRKQHMIKAKIYGGRSQKLKGIFNFSFKNFKIYDFFV